MAKHDEYGSRLGDNGRIAGVLLGWKNGTAPMSLVDDRNGNGVLLIRR